MSNGTDTGSEYTGRTDGNDENKSPERLEREVDQARARLGRTAGELSDRLSPGELIDQALVMAREHGGDFGRNLGTQVKNNPVPLILTGIGISWMMMASDRRPMPRPTQPYDAGASHGHKVKDAVGNTVAHSREKAGEMGDRMHEASDSMKDSAQHARDSLSQFYREQPLIAGSLGIALGAALGSLIPPTKAEDDAFGEARDRSVEAAKSEASKKYDEVRESVRS